MSLKLKAKDQVCMHVCALNDEGTVFNPAAADTEEQTGRADPVRACTYISVPSAKAKFLITQHTQRGTTGYFTNKGG